MGVKLVVPYKSQEGPNAAFSNNDCGPACINMMLAAMGTDVTIDSMYRTGPGRHLLSTGLISMTTLRQLARAYGLELNAQNRTNGMTLDGLRDLIAAGRPALLLVDYKPMKAAGVNGMQTTGNFGHFVLAVGYDGNNFLIHDPYFKPSHTGYGVWSAAVLESCWNHGSGSSGNFYQRSSLVPVQAIAAIEGPVIDVPEEIQRLLRAKAVFEGVAVPPVTDQASLDEALAWLGDWGKEKGVYIVEAGDTLSRVAQNIYRDWDMWQGLAEFNGISNPNLIEIGQRIEYPILPGMGELIRPVKEVNYTNQQVINAFYFAYKPISAGDLTMYWEKIKQLGLQDMAVKRHQRYSGPPLESLDLPDAVKKAILERLDIAIG